MVPGCYDRNFIILFDVIYVYQLWTVTMSYSNIFLQYIVIGLNYDLEIE